MDCDLALINGKVIDPSDGTIVDADVAVTGGKIVAISERRGMFNAGRTIDLTGT